MMKLPELTLPQMLRERARTDAQRIAVRQKDFGIWKPFTWAQYLDRASHFGLGLRALGLPMGGHVGVIAENRIEWVLAQMGAGQTRAAVQGPPRRTGCVPLPALRSNSREIGRASCRERV